jgi:hypothetical protein
MPGTEDAVRAPSLRKRTWVGLQGIGPVVVVSTVASLYVAVYVPRPFDLLVIAALLSLGVAVFVYLTKRFGAEQAHQRVAVARSIWVRTALGGWMEPDGPADVQDVSLALPRSWEVVAACGRLRFPVEGTVVRAETWVLHPVRGSKRSPSRVEVVAADAVTGPGRVFVPIGASVDPLLVTPAASLRGRSKEEPVWAQAVRERVRQHRDVLATVSVGRERVMLFALDDPRLETLERRAQLVRDIAVMVSQTESGR